MTDRLSIQTRAAGPHVFVCAVAGEIDARTAPEVPEVALPELKDGRSVVLDLSGVGYTSSAGLRMLLLLHRHAEASHTRLVLAGLPDAVSEVMSATGFLDAFEQAPDVDAAVELLS
jgi:anti-anti-sigma factor